MTDETAASRIGLFVDVSTCWEYKSEQLLTFSEDTEKQVVCRQQEIPAFTRILEAESKFVFIPEQRPKNSLNQREILLQEHKTIPNSSLNPMKIIECYTPITNQFLGWCLVSPDSILANISVMTNVTEPNCFLVPDIANDWILQVYTIKHIKKNDPLILFKPQGGGGVFVATQNEEYNWNSRAVAPWLPAPLHFLSPILAPYIVDTKMKLKDFSVNHFFNWQLHVLIYAIRIILDPKHHKIDMLVKEFNSVYAKNRQSAPFLLQSLFIEGLINAETNPKWFSHFSARTLMNARATNLHIQ